MENKAGELKVTLTLDADQFKAQLNEIEEQLDRVLEKVDRVEKFGKEAAAATTAHPYGDSKTGVSYLRKSGCSRDQNHENA